MAPFKLIVPIADFEKVLLDEFFTSFAVSEEFDTINDAAIVHEVFARWRWSNDVLRSVRSTCLEELSADRDAQLWKQCLSCLTWERKHESGPLHSRVQSLRERNPDPPEMIPVDQKHVLNVEALADDMKYWKMISNIFLAVRYNLSSFSSSTKFLDMFRKHGVRPATYEPSFSTSGDMMPPWVHTAASDSTKFWDDFEDQMSHDSMILNLRTSSNCLPSSARDVTALRNCNLPMITQPNPIFEPDEFEIWSLLRKGAIIERHGRQADEIWAAVQDCRLGELEEFLAAAAFSGERFERYPQFPIVRWQLFLPPQPYHILTSVSNTRPHSLSRPPTSNSSHALI